MDSSFNATRIIKYLGSLAFFSGRLSRYKSNVDYDYCCFDTLVCSNDLCISKETNSGS
jgi:hypothetical protein